MQTVLLSQWLVVLIAVIGSGCDARSTKVSAQYTVGDGTEPQRTFGTRGIVEDAVIEDGGILTKSTTPTRKAQRSPKRRPSTQSPSSNPSPDYEQLSFQPEIFAVKGKVLDDVEPIPAKSRGKTRTKTSIKHSVVHPVPTQASTKNPIKYPSIQNEEFFDSKLQEAPSALSSKKYKVPVGNDESVYSYSTIKFSADDGNDDSYVGKIKSKAPKRSTSITPASLFNFEQTYHGKPEDDFSFKPSAKISKGKLPGKLLKTPEDEFKADDFYDFSIRTRPGQVVNQAAKFKKFESDLGVKSLAIKSHKNKFDPPMQGGFKPSFKLRDFPNLHGSNLGSGIASPGQIKSYYDAEEAERDRYYKQKLLSDSHPASKAQYAQFLRAKEDERLERLVEEQFRLQQQKVYAQEKEAELKLQQAHLIREREKLKQAEKQLNNKVTRQVTRQKRRPNASNLPRRQRNPSPVNFNGERTIPLRTLKSNDGTYRVSFNVQ